MRISRFTALVLVLASSAAAQTTVWYVDAGAPPGQAGISWGQAFDSLDDALAVVLPNQQIWVKNGVYAPSIPTIAGDPRSNTFSVPPDIEIYGGFLGTENDPLQRPTLHNTVLTGERGGPQAADNVYHVVSMIGAGSPAALPSLLDRFHIEKGYADLPGQQGSQGGGIIMFYASGNLRDCVIQNNHADDGGGGLFIDYGNLQVARCTFASNSSSQGGALKLEGIESYSLVWNTVFKGNVASDGGAVFEQLSLFGAGVHTFFNCALYDNQATGRGGGVFLCPQAESVWANCTIAFNTCFTGDGSGVYDESGPSRTEMTNVIVQSNSSLSGAVDYYVACPQCAPTASHSNTNPLLAGSGNLDEWPSFMNAQARDLRLVPGTFGVNAGLTSGVIRDVLNIDDDTDFMEPTPLDLALVPRVTGGGVQVQVDMGAYEVQ